MPERIPGVDTFVGRALRLPLRLIPQDLRVTVLWGPGRGLRWIHGSGPAGMWLGFNELRKRSRFTQLISPGDVVYDIGAHVGSYTLLAARSVGPSGQVFAFEPMPENLSFLRSHLQLNAVSNVVVHPVALWSDETTVAFQRRADRVSGGISEEGDVLVKTTTVDHFVRTGERPPNCMKIDVEGAESAVLQGAKQTLRDHLPIVFVATHSPEQDRLCRDALEAAGYAVSDIDGHPDELIGVPK